MKTKLLCVLYAALLSGCFTPQHIERLTPEQIAQRSKLSRDQFRKNTVLEGMNLQFGEMGINSYGLSATKYDADPSIDYTVWMATKRSPQEGWAFWQDAHDQNGNELVRPATSRRVGTDAFTLEAISFSVTRQWLNQAATNGIVIRIDGQRAQQQLSLPANYVTGFLLSADNAFPLK